MSGKSEVIRCCFTEFPGFGTSINLNIYLIKRLLDCKSGEDGMILE